MIELRDRPLRAAIAVAEPVLAELGVARRVVLVPGNHDHQLAREAAALRGGAGTPEVFVTVSKRAGGALGRIRAALGTDLIVAYPGVWLADGVWATHGHYLDAHSAAPTVECVAAALVGLARRRPPSAATTPGDYEAVLSPTYASTSGSPSDAASSGSPTRERGWYEASSEGSGSATDRGPAAATARPRRGRYGTAPGELRRPGVRPLRRVLERLGIEAEHVVFGHTHRTGPVLGGSRGHVAYADRDPAVEHRQLGLRARLRRIARSRGSVLAGDWSSMVENGRPAGRCAHWRLAPRYRGRLSALGQPTIRNAPAPGALKG